MAPGVMLVGVYVERFVGHIHLASEDGLEYLFLKAFRLFAFLCGQCGIAVLLRFLCGSLGILYGAFGLGVFFRHIVEKLLDAEHVAVVGDGQGRHAVCHGLVDQRVD